MNEIVKRDIGKLKYLTKEEREYLFSKSPNLNEYLAVSFQECLRNSLLEYLNTPFLLSIKKSKSLHALEKTYLELKINSKKLDFNSTIKDLPEIIIYSYVILEELLNKIAINKSEKTLKFTTLEKGYYSSFPVLEDYVEYTQKKLTKYLKASIIHGSCSDLKLTYFSDLDTLLIINKETITSTKLLIEFKSHWIDSLKYLYKFDSLQHHNHMIATEYDLEFFPYHWLPPQVLKESRLIYGDVTLKFKLNRSDFFNSKTYFLLTQRFKNPNITDKKYNEYSLKNDISILALLPALYLQVIGLDITKKESFNHNKFHSLDHGLLYKKISEIRNHWKVSRTSRFIISKYYNFYLRKLYLKYFIKSIGTGQITINSKIREKFLIDLNILIGTMTSIILKQVK